MKKALLNSHGRIMNPPAFATAVSVPDRRVQRYPTPMAIIASALLWAWSETGSAVPTVWVSGAQEGSLGRESTASVHAQQID